MKKYEYDYIKQVWLKDGIPQDCGHPQDFGCNCYGRRYQLFLGGLITEEEINLLGLKKDGRGSGSIEDA
jgi:hypothetical protein